MTSSTHYFAGEGRPYIQECLRKAFSWAADHEVSTVVVFTGTGEGPLFAAQRLLPDFGTIHLVAVTPPVGRPYKVTPSDPKSDVVSAGVPTATKEFLLGFGVPVISAHLPFKPVLNSSKTPWSTVEAAFGILGGGFALCVQAVLVACDAGEVNPGNRVVAVSADTAICAFASRTETFLSPTEGLLIEHIICRPRRYTVSKPAHASLGVPVDVPAANELSAPGEAKLLPEAKTPRPKKT